MTDALDHAREVLGNRFRSRHAREAYEVLANAALRVLTDGGTVEAVMWAVREEAQRQAGLSLSEKPDMDIREFVRACLTAILELAQGEK